MQFDFIVGNPPYGLRTGNIHLKILKTSLPYSSHQLVFIMPSKPLVEETECNNMLRNAVCTSVDVMPKEIFPTTDMECTAIDTDEGILRECGFTEDEIEKTMEYLNNFDFSQNRNDMIRDFENK